MLRAVRVRSKLGRVEVINPDAGAAGASGAWDLTSLIGSGSLAPNASTRAKTVQFRIVDPDPRAAEKSGAVLDIEARVYAKKG